MQPYQEASEEIQRQGEIPSKFLKKGANTLVAAAATATAYGGGSALFKRVLPFLSKYIPQDIAVKGLSKLDPRFEKFINKSLENGESFENIKDFIKEKGTVAEKPKENKKNIIQQYSDELHQFLTNEINQGRPPIEAGALAQLDDRYKNIIKKIEDKHKTNWSSILQTIYGAGQYGGAVNPVNNQVKSNQIPQHPNQVQPPHPNSAKGSQLSRQQPQQPMQPQNQGQENTEQSIMAALQKVMQL